MSPRVIAQDVPQPETLPLWPDQAPIGDGKFQDAKPSITVYRPQNPNGTALVICPGGGYGQLMIEPEGRGIARWLNQHRITGVVLSYRLPQGNPLLPLLDAQRALRLTRARAADWKLDPKRIGIIGFSAGGHVASMAGTHAEVPSGLSNDPLAAVSCRPDFMVLIYPVITMGADGHAGSRNALLGPQPKPELVDLYSNEKQVADQTPPTFLAHAKDDGVVPPKNSFMFYQALLAHHVPAQYLELLNGGHGLNNYHGPSWDAWQTESLLWLTQQQFISPPK